MNVQMMVEQSKKQKKNVRKYKRLKMYRSDTSIQMNIENTKDKNIKLKLVDIYKFAIKA